MTAPSDGDFPRISTEYPTPARMYDYTLGGKDNFEVDRMAVLGSMEHFPEGLDNARNNRLFLYRVVRYLASEVGIRQYLDMGSGLPTENNVHQVAQRFQPDTKVVYVDNDPIVLAHGRALLARDASTTVLSADMTEVAAVLAHPQTTALLDLSEPVAVLFLSVGHSVVEDEALRAMLTTIWEQIPSGSYLAYTQMTSLEQAVADHGNALARSQNWAWKVRTQAEVVRLLESLDPAPEPVPPGIVDVVDWRPDPQQPPLASVDEPLRRYLGASAKMEYRGGEFGGLLRKP